MVEKAKSPRYVIPGFIFTIIITIVFLCLLIFVLYPKIIEINEEKLEVKNKIENLQTLKKKGISFDEFNTLKTSYNTNDYLSLILKRINGQFFNTNFVNNSEGEDFNTFFNKKLNEINILENSVAYKKAQESYKNILPTYVENNYKNEEGVMTDLKFVTYLESLLYTFGLEMPNKSLSVGNLNILSEYVTDKEAPLDTTIFYIPYTFNIAGKKSDVIDFIYFLENVGSISENDQGIIEVNEDNFINKSLAGFENSNLFENQIIDIEAIKMTNYIDSGVEAIDNGKLIDNIKRTQGKEKIDISLDVRFYVKGVPNYKIQDGITKLIERYDVIKADYDGKIANKDITNEQKIKAEKGVAYLKELDVSIKEIKKEKTDLNKAFKKVIEVSKLLDILEDKLNN